MKARILKIVWPPVVGLAVAAGLVFLGRATADTSGPHSAGYRAGHSDGYFAGLNDGEAEGRQDGRALQIGDTVPAASRQVATDAFNAGYAAGADDAFAGYDGGWALSAPYVVVLERGSGSIDYRIQTRDPVLPDTDYYLCGGGHAICTQARH